MQGHRMGAHFFDLELVEIRFLPKFLEKFTRGKCTFRTTLSLEYHENVITESQVEQYPKFQPHLIQKNKIVFRKVVQSACSKCVKCVHNLPTRTRPPGFLPSPLREILPGGRPGAKGPAAPRPGSGLCREVPCPPRLSHQTTHRTPLTRPGTWKAGTDDLSRALWSLRGSLCGARRGWVHLAHHTVGSRLRPSVL